MKQLPQFYAIKRFSFLIATLFLFSQVAYSQSSIDLEYEETLISDILIDIAGHFNKDISFNQSYFENKRLTISKKRLSLNGALNRVLQDQEVEHKISQTEITLQKYLQIHGYISDALSGERLIGAHIYADPYPVGSWSNEEGFFSFKIPAETTGLVASYIGYDQKTVPLTNASDIQKRPIKITVSPSETFETVVISANDLEETPINMLRGQDILATEINTLVSAGGEPDIMQYLYTQAGITTGPDGIGGLHVRGGQVDQNLYLLDGATVYNPSHSFGLHSIFNTDRIQLAEFKKSGFSATESGRTASILDMRTLDGDMKKWNADLSLSTLASGIQANGPIIKDKVSLLIGARRTHIGKFLRDYTKNEKANNVTEGFSDFKFYDLYGKLNFHLGKKDKIIISAYKGKDNYSDDNYDAFDLYDDDFGDEAVGYEDYYTYSEFNWGNELLSLRWNHIYGGKLFSTTTLAFSKFSFDSYSYYEVIFEDYVTEEFYQDYEITNFLSAISDRSAKHKFEYYPTEKHHISFGLGASQKFYSPGYFNIEYGSVEEYDQEFIDDYISDETDNYFKSNDLTLFVNDEIKLSPKTSANLGLNGSIFQSENILFNEKADYKLWQANLKLVHQLSSKTALAIAFDKMYQPLHVVSTSSIGFPNDLWVPSTPFIKPQESYQVDLSLQYSAASTKIRMNLYYKKLDNIIRYNFDENLPSLLEIRTQFWEAESVVGSGTAYGVELNTSYSTEYFKTMINYAYTDTQRNFIGLNDDQDFPYEYDLRHTLSINTLLRIKKKLWLYANWNYRSGLRQTLYASPFIYSAVQNQYDDVLTQISSVNGDTEKAFHRLDMGINWSHQGEHVTHFLTLGVQNVYNQQNNYFSYLLEDIDGQQANERFSKRALPLLPTLTYKISI